MDLEDVRRVALSFPEAREAAHRGRPAWRVQGRIFAWEAEEPGVVTLKLDRHDQLAFLEAEPEAVAPGKWYSHHGWTRLRLDRTNDELAHTLLRLAWAHVAPARLRRTAACEPAAHG